MERGLMPRLGHRFEELVAALFVHQGFTVHRSNARTDREHDFVVQTPSVAAVVEIKLYTSMRTATGSIIQALDRLERARMHAEATFGILAISSRLTALQRSQVDRYPQLRIYDFDVLAALAADDPKLALEFEDISRHALVFRGEDLPTAGHVDVRTLVQEIGGSGASEPATPSEPPPVPDGMGAQLCEDIHAVAASQGKPFEQACAAAIRYLFADELVAFDDQHASHTGQHQFDMVARIASKEDFWQALITDFRARYVVFEFKNYKNQISQREIYTTEKYLYPIAMRGAAIIVSRHGADDGADKAMRGALREAGKLILSVSVEELCAMLHARDAGSDHLVTLVEKLDTMLMGLER